MCVRKQIILIFTKDVASEIVAQLPMLMNQIKVTCYFLLLLCVVSHSTHNL